MSYSLTPTKKSASSNKLLIIAACILIIIVAAVAISEATNTTYFFHKRPPRTTASQNTKGEVAPQTNAETSAPAQPNSTSADKQPKSGETQPGDNKSNTTTTPEAVLLTPTGDFVSAHGTIDHPLSENTPITSVCNTTSGATCIITFSKDTTTISLDPHTTDRGGAAYWNNWTPASIKLSSGEWHITATAKLNGQTKTADDAKSLIIE